VSPARGCDEDTKVEAKSDVPLEDIFELAVTT
jgi:hypothetical protein